MYSVLKALFASDSSRNAAVQEANTGDEVVLFGGFINDPKPQARRPETWNQLKSNIAFTRIEVSRGTRDVGG
jgi:hypothetical protein